MGNEVTSADVATIASRIMRTPRAIGSVSPVTYNSLLDDAKSVAGSALTQCPDADSSTQNAKSREAIPPVVSAQMEGEPLEPTGVIETNFGFYVGGWTLKGTGVVGEVHATNMDGAEVIFNSASLTTFLKTMAVRNLPGA